MQVASVALGLVSTQAPLNSCSTRPAKLPFFQKATSVVVIVKFTAYARDELNILAMPPSPLLSKSSMQKGRGGGGIFSGAYGTCGESLYINCSSNHSSKQEEHEQKVH